MRMRTHRAPGRHAARSTALAVTVAAGLVAGACGNVYDTADPAKSGGANGAPGGTGPAGNTANPSGEVDRTKIGQKNPSKEPGVTDTAIRIGGVTAKTNILNLPVEQSLNGTKAYFEMVNSQGGIWGRKLELAEERDDQMMKNKEEAQALAAKGDIFAVAPVATPLFTGSQVFADSGIPTFGWNINPEWGGPPNLFGEKGSDLCVTCGYPMQSFVAREIGAKKVAVIAYGVDQSARCVEGVKAGFQKYPTAELAFVDDSVQFGNTDYGVQVQKMRDAGVQMLITCMDTGAVISLAREVAKQGVKIPQYVQMGYDYDMLAEYGKEFEGSFVMTQFVPFEFPQQPTGIQNYLKWLAKIPGAKKGELSLAGWLNADLLYRGIALAGPDFTRQKVIDSINQLTNWHADGISPGFDWTVVHSGSMRTNCQAFSKIEGGKFVPAFTEGDKPFVCFDNEATAIPDTPRHKAGGEALGFG